MKLFYNSTFYSMKNPYDTYRAVLVEGERIKAVFRKEPDAGIEAEKVDMGGVYVLPGFIDAHTHSYTGGLYTLAVSLARAKSLSDVFNLLACAEKIEDRIIAWQYDEANIKEGRFPLVSELDKLFPHTPVIIRRIDGHSCRINTAACKRINWSESFSLNENELLIGTLNNETLNWAHHCSRDIVLKAYEAAVHMHNNNERLTPFEAVQLYTCNAAYVSFDEKRLGYILPGYQADMVCLDKDPFKAENLKEIKIKTVIKKGRLVLTRDGDRV
jgi:predicted amidohydrolase YtcJ